ncbi:MAG TPA: protein kinase [Myxococcaceae bacterium]|nr:protein kinase [Myxococcaceae bacterium]
MDAGRDVLDVGAVLGETYRIQSLIGRGGMGAVWAAEHLRLPGKHVAVKVLLDAAAGGEEMLQRFRREAEIASRLGHPNIVEVLDFNTLPTGQPYIVLEYLQGETLAARLASGRLQLDEALAITRQIGSALQAAHRAGVVHRDLKPDNVFLCTPEEDMPTRVKVLDFGISKIRGSQSLRTQDAILMGTPQYMSPEQATGRNTTVDARTDVFAVGAIVYEMLGGQPAFAGGSLAEVVYRVVHGEPTPLRELAPALPENVLTSVERALQKDPANRPQDIGAFILELTGRPLHSFHTGQPRNVDSTVGTLEPTHTPQPTGPTGSWPKTRASSREPVRSGAVTVPPAMPEAAPRRLWPFLVLMAVLGVALGGVGVLWASRRNAAPTLTRTASLDPLEPVKRIEPPPPPPPVPHPPQLAVEPPTVKEPPSSQLARAEPHAHEKPPPGRKHRARIEGAKATEPQTVASAEPVKAVEPEPPPPPATPADGIKPEARKLLEQAEDALSKNKPLDAARLVDQSFFIQKTALGYAIQARAACQRHDVGGARAAFRNITEQQLKQIVLRACVRQGVWLF